MGRKAPCPLASRIKKIMQKDEDVGKIGQATPVLICRAMELLLKKICDKTYEIASGRQAKAINASHVKHCVMSEETLDFLKETVAGAPDMALEEPQPSKAAAKRQRRSKAADDSDDGGEPSPKPRKSRAKKKDQPLADGEQLASPAAAKRSRKKAQPKRTEEDEEDEEDCCGGAGEDGQQVQQQHGGPMAMQQEELPADPLGAAGANPADIEATFALGAPQGSMEGLEEVDDDEPGGVMHGVGPSVPALPPAWSVAGGAAAAGPSSAAAAAFPAPVGALPVQHPARDASGPASSSEGKAPGKLSLRSKHPALAMGRPGQAAARKAAPVPAPAPVAMQPVEVKPDAAAAAAASGGVVVDGLDAGVGSGAGTLLPEVPAHFAAMANAAADMDDDYDA